MRTVGQRSLIVFLFGLSALLQTVCADEPPDAITLRLLHETQADIKRTALDITRELHALGVAPTIDIPLPAGDGQYEDAVAQFRRSEYPDVIVLLESGRHNGAVDRRQARLFRSRLLAAYGLPGAAERIFQDAAEADMSAAVRSASLLHLAQSFYRQGAYAETERVLARARDDVPLRSARRLLEARAAMALGRYGQAVEVLEAPAATGEGGFYARYNLGVALLRSGREADGAAVLDRLGRGEGDSEEARALLDRVNVTLGFALLRQGNASGAKEAFERVRVDAPLAPRALLGLGWTEWDQRNWRRALVPWTKLQRMDPSDEAVIEAWAMLPEALNALGSHARAADRFREAAGMISREIARLEQALSHYRSDEAVRSLLMAAHAAPQPGGWRWDDIETLPAAPYLIRLLSGDPFQAVLTGYRDLGELDEQLGARADLPGAGVLRPRIEALRSRIGAARDAHARFVRQAIRYELGERHARLRGYLVRTRHTLARLLDDMAHQGDDVD